MPGPVAAFFDFDQTLLDTSSGKLGIRYMRDHGGLPSLFLIKIMAANLLYKPHIISEETMSRLLIGIYKGRTLDEFAVGAPDFYRECLNPHLAPNILAKVREHKDRGHLLVLISGSVRYMLQPVVDDIGFDHLVCTDLEIGPDGFLTGRPKGPICVDRHKGRLAGELVEREKLDLANSFAYGNHQSDIPLLEMVGHPSVVEPTAPLKRLAIRKNWPILSFR